MTIIRFLYKNRYNTHINSFSSLKSICRFREGIFSFWEKVSNKKDNICQMALVRSEGNSVKTLPRRLQDSTNLNSISIDTKFITLAP